MLVILLVSTAAAQADTLAWYRLEDGAAGQVMSIATDETGNLIDGTAIEGTDDICIVP